MSKPPVNIWESLLRESSKRGRLPEGSVLVLGHAGCGKSHLVAKLCAPVTSPNATAPAAAAANNSSSGSSSSSSGGTNGAVDGSNASDSSSNKDAPSSLPEPISDVMAYDSFVAGDSEESLSDDLASSRIGLWSLSEQTFEGAPAIVLQPDRVEKLVIMITLDLSKVAQCRDTLIYWLREARGYLNKYFERLGEGAGAQHREDCVEYLRAYRDGMHLPPVPGPAAGVDVNLGVPVIVVGCKADRMVLTEAVSLKKYNELQRDLREICFKTGAALVYSSASSGVNVSRLRRYVLHRLYPDLLPLKMDIEPSSSELFVPAGVDTLEMAAMSGATGAADAASALAALSGFSAATLDIASNLAGSAAGGNPAGAGSGGDATGSDDAAGLVVLEDEKAWLASLLTAIEASVQSSTASSGALDAAPIPAPSATADAPAAAAKPTTTAGAPAADAAASAAAVPSRPKTRRQSAATTAASQAGAEGGAKSDEAVRGFFESLLTK